MEIYLDLSIGRKRTEWMDPLVPSARELAVPITVSLQPTHRKNSFPKKSKVYNMDYQKSFEVWGVQVNKYIETQNKEKVIFHLNAITVMSQHVNYNSKMR